MANKIWKREEIEKLIATNDAFVARSLVKLFNRQLADEKRTESTRYHNNVGFNHAEAEMIMN